MSASWAVVDGGGRRRVGESDFPLVLGGPGAGVALPGVDGGEPLAYLGLSAGEVFAQAADGARVLHNGQPLTASRWLRHGDELTVGAARLAVAVEGGEMCFTARGSAAGGDATTTSVILTPPATPASGGRQIRPIDFRPAAAAGAGRRRWPRLGMLLLWALLATLAAFATFLFTARSVRVAVEPAPDRLTLAGGLLRPELGGRYLLRPGEYVVTAEKAGYRRLETALEVTSDSDQSFAFALEKLPGLLAIETVAGAEVWIDGERLGVAPLAPAEVAPGEREVVVRAERYAEHRQTVAIEGGGARQTLTAELLPLWAEIAIDSQPRGARVRAGGEALGTTPVTAQLLAGSHGLELTLAGYKPHRRRLEVVAGEPQTLPAVRLVPADGNLLLTSEPAGATVAVDGVYRGETPLDLFLSPGSAHAVSVSKAGYGAERSEVRLRSGESRELAVTLVAQEGELEILAWPPDAELIVNGEARGKAWQTVSLAAVPHVIEVQKEGFLPFRKTVTPLPGIRQELEVMLEKPEEVQARATPPVIHTSEGHELRLIAGGRFRMGASRREPGRRANEGLREVEISRRFYLATQEVSNQQFRHFAKEHLSGQVAGKHLETDHHPAVRMSWEQAAAYCNWLSRKESLPVAYERRGGRLVAVRPLSTGYRLPTEAEWAWAARYAGGEPSKYPWGDALPVAPESGNYADSAAGSVLPTTLPDYHDGFPVTAPVASYEPNALGLRNLGGNVAEWIHDLYAVRSAAAAGSVERDPLGPEEGEFHVVRGSSWMHSTVTQLRWTYRDYAAQTRPDVGFRIARYADEPEPGSEK